MRTLLNECRTRAIPTFITRVSYANESGAEGGRFFEKVPSLRCFVAGNPLGEYVEGLQPVLGTDVEILKHFPSGFFRTSLHDELQERSVDTVLIGGFSTSGCVRATALDALQHGYVPLVVEDAAADRDEHVQHANLADIAAKCGEVIALSEALIYLESVAVQG